jgi:hypothetical protein
MPYFIVLHLYILTRRFIKSSYITYIIYIVLRTYICYTIDTVKEKNKPKSKNPLPITNKFTANTKSGKAKMKRVDNCITKKSG